jgi:hypothetical protein
MLSHREQEVIDVSSTIQENKDKWGIRVCYATERGSRVSEVES